MKPILVFIGLTVGLVACFGSSTTTSPTSGGGAQPGTFHTGPYTDPDSGKQCGSPGGYCDDDKQCHSSADKCHKQ